MVCTFPVASDVRSTVDELVDLGWRVNADQYRIVHLAARYDDEHEWFTQGFKSAGAALAKRLAVRSSTTREWVRVGHTLSELPLIDAAFAANEISYAKVRVLTRWAEPDNEAELLALAKNRSAGRLATAIAQALAVDDDDQEGRDGRQHDSRSFTSYTDGDGMVVIRVVLPPLIAKVILAAIEELVRLVAKTPAEDPSSERAAWPSPPTSDDPFGSAERRGHGFQDADTGDQWLPDGVDGATTPGELGASANASGRRCVGSGRGPVTIRESGATADAPDSPAVVDDSGLATAGGERLSGDSRGFPKPTPAMAETLREMREQWQPGSGDDWMIPTLAQQRADAFVAFFLRLDIELTTEVVLHVRGDGNTFDDGTPLTDSAVACQLDDSFIRLLIHDAERRPVNASSRRRYPTTRQRRVVMEAHNHECVDCEGTDLLEFDHNPPYHQTGHTITDELELRCAPCHRARHRSSTAQQIRR